MEHAGSRSYGRRLATSGARVDSRAYAARLLLVVGTSPQVITESVYSLRNMGSGPVDVRVLTTEVGLAAIVERMLPRGGAWEQLRKAYPSTRRFLFDRDRIRVLRDAAGLPLGDLRNGADSVAAADQILAAVRTWTDTSEPPLHASIAGGRKTMGFLLAAAMMLCGRIQDRLSHVLVHPARYESSEFFFPAPPVLRPTRRQKSQEGRPCNPVGSDCVPQVDLVELPFPRLREVGGIVARRTQSFSELVANLQRSLDAMNEPHLIVDARRGLIACNGYTVRLTPARVAIYEALAVRRRDGCGQALCPGCEGCHLPVDQVEHDFARTVRKRLQALESIGVSDRGWRAANFRSERTKINVALRRVLHEASAMFEVHHHGPRGARLYGLRLPPPAIELVNRDD